mmetsp:Transcript_89456/g.253471  ORF Transcript_89456/g.253471 Transcript_89456/m.253471 type:complete len:294 (+) Transcript_89456:216-1097(+)
MDDPLRAHLRQPVAAVCDGLPPLREGQPGAERHLPLLLPRGRAHQAHQALQRGLQHPQVRPVARAADDGQEHLLVRPRPHGGVEAGGGVNPGPSGGGEAVLLAVDHQLLLLRGPAPREAAGQLPGRSHAQHELVERTAVTAEHEGGGAGGEPPLLVQDRQHRLPRRAEARRGRQHGAAVRGLHRDDFPHRHAGASLDQLRPQQRHPAEPHAGRRQPHAPIRARGHAAVEHHPQHAREVSRVWTACLCRPIARHHGAHGERAEGSIGQLGRRGRSTCWRYSMPRRLSSAARVPI